GDDARGRSLAVVLVVGDQETDLLEAGAGIDQERDALARGQLPLLVLLGDPLLPAPLAKPSFQLLQLADQAPHARLRGRGREPFLRPANPGAHEATASRSRPCCANQSRM